MGDEDRPRFETIKNPNYHPPDPAKVARRRGGGIQQAYSLAHKLEGALALARDEAVDRTERATIGEAMSDLYRLREKINRILAGR